MSQIINNNDTHVKGVLTVTGIIESIAAGVGKTFTNSDNGKIFHITGENSLTVPQSSTLDEGWTIGIVNMSGDTITIASSASDTINEETTITNTMIYSGLYVYKSNVSGKFVSIGTLY